MKEEFRARMLCIHLTESEQWEGKPLHEAIVATCKELGLASASVYRGVEGFGAEARIHRPRSLSLSDDTPVMVNVIDTEAQLQKLMPHLGRMLAGGMLAASDVQVIHYTRSDS